MAVVSSPRAVRAFAAVPGLCLFFLLFASPAAAQRYDSTQRARAHEMLAAMRLALRQHYHDRTYGGRDLDAAFNAARARLDTATTIPEAYGIIAGVLEALGDSHTYFIPPQPRHGFFYGWEMRMVGEDCYVVAVNPASDAAVQGLRPGDRVVEFEGRVPTRGDLARIHYLYYTLSPRAALTVVVQSPGGSPRRLRLATRITEGRSVEDVNPDNAAGQLNQARDLRMRQSRVATQGSVRIWKLPAFDVEHGDMDRLAAAATKGATGLVLDLRGNGGGLVKSLEQLTRHFFSDRDVTIARLTGRDGAMKPLIARRQKGAFAGGLVVLIDAASGSAAEVLARTVQIEGRGTVIGDRSKGAVRQAVTIGRAIELPGSTMIFFGASITNAELRMADGSSLEGVGVEPDERVLPTAEDMAAGRDPALARALARLGVTVDPATAAALFPVRWKAPPR